ncbi:out at first protein homolog isoform X1 [Coregonus clupeaformis]|uniref:out at first protein homolog isoform X1 n=1 Tax=Coregonus clupeaformis TaxID=59861 RepID=UPI001E1C654B|nr:out at first protein homolog isoform X1 [Coregonus clupeaformis]
MSLGMYAREISAVAAVLISLLVVNLFGSLGISSELKVRVRLSDGQIAEEILEADSEKDSITVEFKQGDGTYITVVFDFKRDVRIIRALILGEPERGQNQYQVLCFISRLNQHEIIPTESMARLRQKNPHLVHMAEERRGVEHLHMDMVVNVSRTGHLNTLIHNLCKEAHEGFYTRTADTKHWLDEGIEAIEFEPLPQTADAAGLQRCPSTLDMWQPCICSYFLRLEWLPCMLKYCRSLLAVAGRANPYKCGIRSCSKGYRFDYYVPHRQLCPWDEET